MKDIDYSVIVRTIGQAGEKYRKLLESINKLVPQPKEVIVVLPEGYELPEDRLGWEKFYFSPKGMVIQRLIGIDKCKTQYGLICDDDVAFESDFVQKLYTPIKEGKGYFSAGPLYSFLPPKGVNEILCTLMASAVPTFFHKDRYNTVLRSSGYSYNRHLNEQRTNYYETQSAAWTCFFADMYALRSICFEEEIWLDAHGYSAIDDQTMFYKAWLNGKKTIIVSDAKYKHLDAKTSTKNNKPAALYSATFNRVVFWRRFIYEQETTIWGRLLASICFKYRMLWMTIWDYLYVIRKKMTREDFKTARKGYRDGCSYVKSKEYFELPSIIK